MYRDGRAHRLARVMNRITARQFAAGILTMHRGVTLEVTGRSTGRPIQLPLVVADYEGRPYLVSMLGDDASWVRNVRAAGGRAHLLRRGRRDPVRLDEVDPGARGPVLRRYLALAPGARAHFPIGRKAPLADFERIAADYPVFRVTITSEPAAVPPPGGSAPRQSRR